MRNPKQSITAAFTACAVTIALIVAFVVMLPDCTTEDSTWCVWDAERSGNGAGVTVINLWGETFLRVR